MADRDDATDTASAFEKRTHRARYDAGNEAPSLALVDAIAAARETDPVALDPLGNSLDMGALDALVQPSRGDHAIQVTVELQGVRATIDSEGAIAVQQTGGGAPGGVFDE